MNHPEHLRQFQSFQKKHLTTRIKPSFDRFSHNDPHKLSRSDIFIERFPDSIPQLHLDYRARPNEQNYKSTISKESGNRIQAFESDAGK